MIDDDGLQFGVDVERFGARLAEAVAGILCAIVAAGSFWIANVLITQYHLYRFGIEEAAAIASVILSGAAALLLATIGTDRLDDAQLMIGLLTAAGVSFALFRRFGFVYGAVIAMMQIGISAVVRITNGNEMPSTPMW